MSLPLSVISANFSMQVFEECILNLATHKSFCHFWYVGLHVPDVAPQTSGSDWLPDRLKSIHTPPGSWWKETKEGQLPFLYIMHMTMTLWITDYTGSISTSSCIKMSRYTTIWPINTVSSPPWHTGPMSSYEAGISWQYILKKWPQQPADSPHSFHMTELRDIDELQLWQLPLSYVGTASKHINRLVCKHVKIAGLPLRKDPASFSPSRMTQP
jgi:hypothetical protein